MAKNHEFPAQANAGQIPETSDPIISPDIAVYQSWASGIEPGRRPTLLSLKTVNTITGPDLLGVVLDDNLAGELDHWENRYSPLKDHEREIAEDSGSMEFNRDGVDMAAITASWADRVTQEGLAADERARVRRDELGAIREKREADIERDFTNKGLSATGHNDVNSSRVVGGGVVTPRKMPEIDLGLYLEEKRVRGEPISSSKYLGEMMRVASSTMEDWRYEFSDTGRIPDYVLRALPEDLQEEYLWLSEENGFEDYGNWELRNDPDFDSGLLVGYQNPREAYKNPYNADADELIAQMFEAPDAQAIERPRLQKNWRVIEAVRRNGRNYTEKESRAIAKQRDFIGDGAKHLDRAHAGDMDVSLFEDPRIAPWQRLSNADIKRNTMNFTLEKPVTVIKASDDQDPDRRYDRAYLSEPKFLARKRSGLVHQSEVADQIADGQDDCRETLFELKII